MRVAAILSELSELTLPFFSAFNPLRGGGGGLFFISSLVMVQKSKTKQAIALKLDNFSQLCVNKVIIS